MNFKEWLEGTVNLKHIGNWDKDAPKRGWNHADIHLTTSPDRVERIHKFFKNCPFDFDITLVRDKKAHSFREIGVVTSKWIKENLNLDYKPNPMAINIVFTNNLGDQKVPFTPWIMAHRFGHAVRFEKDWQYFTKELDKTYRDILRMYYDYDYNPWKKGHHEFDTHDLQILKNLSINLGTMKSAKIGTLRNHYEFPYELLAQYISKGSIHLNDFPKQIIKKKQFVYGKPNHKTLTYNSEYPDEVYKNQIEEEIQNNIYHVLRKNVGKIFVM